MACHSTDDCLVHTLSHAEYHATDFTMWQQVVALDCLDRCAHGYRTRKKKRDGGMSRRL